MSFRKRSIGLSPSSSKSPTTNSSNASPPQTLPGTRPSPVDGRPTTSTGIASLDSLLAGHGGLALGTSLLIEENGTTDFAGAMLRMCAAEGLVQGQQVHVVGVGEGWGRELPGVAKESGKEKRDESKSEKEKERMKIAWRYERLGEFRGERGVGRGPNSTPTTPTTAAAEQRSQAAEQRSQAAEQRSQAAEQRSQAASTTPSTQPTTPFSHTFDLTTRLTPSPNLHTIPIPPSTNPFPSILTILQNALITHPNQTHRILLPTLLSPAIYPPSATSPTHLLPFLHALRALLRQHSTTTILLLTLPLALHPRTTGLTRSIELLTDGVIELSPFPSHTIAHTLASSGAATATEEKPQGMLKMHRVPVLHERGGGGKTGDVDLGEELAFTLSRRRFGIRPFSLPPVEGDAEAQEQREGGKGKELEF